MGRPGSDTYNFDHIPLARTQFMATCNCEGIWEMGLGKKYVVPTTETLHLMTMGSGLGELSI